MDFLNTSFSPFMTRVGVVVRKYAFHSKSLSPDAIQGLDGEATEPMIKELEEDREESQDPEVEFAIAGAVREYDGLEIILGMIQVRDLCH